MLTAFGDVQKRVRVRVSMHNRERVRGKRKRDGVWVGFQGRKTREGGERDMGGGR